MTNRKIGTIYGITTPYKVKIAKIRDMSITLKRGQFVKMISSDGISLLGRVSSIRKSNPLLTESLIPDLGDADLDSIDEMGIPRDIMEHVLADVEIIGVRSGKRFVRPRQPSRPGDFVYYADDAFMKQLLAVEGTISIGRLRDNLSVVANIDYQELVSKHFAVLAMTGGGKSYLAGVIIEELAAKLSLPIIILDPHGEYSSMAIPREGAEHEEQASTVSERVKVFVIGDVSSHYEAYFKQKFGVSRNPRSLRFHPGEFERYQIVALVNSYYGLSQAQARVLEKSWDDVRIAYTEGELQSEEDIFKVIFDRVEGPGEGIAFRTLKTKLHLLFRRRYLHFGDSASVNDYVSKNQISVIDLGGMEITDQQAVAALLARLAFEARKERHIPPMLVVVEEAHRFIPPSSSSSASGTTFKRIASEGRKFLLGLGIVSQRPSKLDSDVLSQCNTQMILRLMNPSDQRYVRDVSEGITDEDLQEIRGLSQGEAYVFGAGVPLPLPVQVRKRWTMDGGFTPKLEDELSKY